MIEFLSINEKTKEKILKEYDKTEENLAEDIEILVRWLKTQHHLPEVPSRRMIQFFLINNKFSLQLTKERLDMYYTIRGLLPDFFGVINPKFDKMKRHRSTCNILPFPKLLDDKYRIILLKEQDVPLSNMDGVAFIGRFVNMQEIRLQEDLSSSNILLVDCQHINLKHTVALTPMHVKMAANLLEKVYSNRIKEIHLFNHNPVVSLLVNLFGTFMKQKVIRRVRLHDSLDSVKKHFPLDVLPRDYGGTLPSVDELEEAWSAKLEEYQDRFDALDSMKVDEALRPTPLEDSEAFGVQGSFKTLSID